MSEDKHTPLPWRVEQGADLIWGACDPDDQSPRGMGYAIVEGQRPGWKPYRPDPAEREANAALIVRSVNSLPALVKALEEIVDVKPGMVTDDELKIAVMKMRNVAICAIAAYRSSPK